MSVHNANSSFTDSDSRVVLIGAGTIGLSFAALHLQYLASPSQLTIHDTRPNLQDYVYSDLPKFLVTSQHSLVSNVTLSTSDESLSVAVNTATVIQEQGPENEPFKRKIWHLVEQHASKSALLWSSTSGIPASVQCADMGDKSRLLIVHPFNPPHIMPLLEVCPSPSTEQSYVDSTLDFWRKRGRQPVVIHKETTGFVANRLAFALLREAVHLVKEGVVNVEELDDIVTSSMGPRWAVAGPFKSYHAGGGPGGLRAFFGNIGGTVQACWADGGRENVGDGDWEENIFQQAEEAYGVVDTMERDRITRKVVETVQVMKKE